MHCECSVGIALVAARHAKVEVLLMDASRSALDKGLAFMGKLARRYLAFADLLTNQIC